MKKLNGVQSSLFFLVWCGVLLYIGSSVTSTDRWLIVTWSIFITSMIAFGILSSAVRARAMRRFANANNLTYTGDDLLKGLLIARTSFALKEYATANFIWGDLRGISLAIFDLSNRSGKSSRSQTIVAFRRTGPNAIPEPPIDAVGSYQFEEAGDWIVAWIPRRTVQVEELEDWCIDVHTLARDLLAEARGESEQRPRLFRWIT